LCSMERLTQSRRGGRWTWTESNTRPQMATAVWGGGGPVESQRMIFGYTGRINYVDSKGCTWRPATEFVARTRDLTDVVAKTWWTIENKNFPPCTQVMEGLHACGTRV